MIDPEDTIFGIDPSGGEKPFAYAVLDSKCKPTLLGEGELEQVLALLSSQRAAIVAVNAPSSTNQGLVRKQMLKELKDPDQQIRGADIRLSENILRRLGIAVSGTPGRRELCPAWVQMGFLLYQMLGEMGYRAYPGKDEDRKYIETQPQACFCVLLGQVPMPRTTLEGRLQRQLVLHERGLGIKDPMVFFEEITRYRLLKGVLPGEQIYSAEMLDALAAAYTAWLVATDPKEVTWVGDKREGQIVLPVKELPERF